MSDSLVHHLLPPAKQVAEMQALIEAAPVPASVADRLVRKVVHDWVFHSGETRTGDVSRSAGDSGNTNTANVHSSSGGSSSDLSRPMLRRPSVSAPFK